MASKNAPQSRERRCILTRKVANTDQLLRFVISPDSKVVLDLACSLPGRGLWLTASRTALERAIDDNLFSRVAKCSATVDTSLVDNVEAELANRALNYLGLARRSQRIVTGYQQVMLALKAGDVAVLVSAGDGAVGGRRKLESLAKELSHVQCLLIAEMSLALGRQNVVHAAVNRGSLASRFMVEVTKLSAFRETPECHPLTKH